jgi:ubiquinone/menaquinone biosynthesis C-methylase UbiE
MMMICEEHSIRTEPTYAMGYTNEERRRLIAQAQLLEDSTRKLFTDAGIREGMTVLDIGCGTGDISFLAATIVGERGKVVGLDRDPRALALARDRAASQGIANVEFLQADVETHDANEQFDALVGRLILLYLSDPVAALQRLSRNLRPGGIVAIQDYQFDHAYFSYPPVPLMEQFWEWFLTTFRRAGVGTSLGLQLYTTFLGAGLPGPRLNVDHPIIYPADPRWVTMPEMVLRSILPLMERFGIATAAEVDLDTWTDRLTREVIGNNAVCSTPMLVGAWAKLPEI